MYKLPTQPSACGIDNEGTLHEGCHCAGLDGPVCKSICDNDEQCKGYSAVAEWMGSGCRVATNSKCIVGCFKTNAGNLGNLVQDESNEGMFAGCFIKTLDSKGRLL